MLSQHDTMVNMETVTLPKQVNSKIKAASKRLGVSKNVFTLNAILFYLQNMEDKIDLKKELNLWENASNADLIRFESGL